MELRQLRYFVRVAETLHFGRAAEREFVARSVMSAQIAALERELGIRLLSRSSREVTLTTAGTAFLADARRTLQELGRAVEQARAVANGDRRLRIGVFGEGAGPLTHLILSAFRSARPDVGIEYVDLSMVDALDSVIDDVVDVAFLRLPVTDPRVRVDPLFAEPRVAVVPAGHDLADAPVLQVEDLLDQPFAVAAAGTPRGWRSYWSFDDERGAACRVGGEVRSIPESLAAIAYRGAVDTFPATAARMFPHPGVRSIPVSDAQASCLALVSLMTREPDDVLDRFREIAGIVVERHLHLIPDASPVSAITSSGR